MVLHAFEQNPFTNYLKDTATHIESEQRKKKSKLIPKTIDSAKYNILIWRFR